MDSAKCVKRGRLIVPFGEFADDLADIDAGMHPFGARPALVGLHDIAAEDQNRHAVAPGIVHRHGGMLQADDAVAGHRHRLAFDLGVALRHVDGDVLVHAGDDLGLVVGVIDDGLVQAAIARGAIDRHIFDAERIEHVGHEVAAARGLIDRIVRRRERLGGGLHRPGDRGLQLRLRRGRSGIGCDWRHHRSGGPDEPRAFEEIAAARSRRLTAFRQGVPSGRPKSANKTVRCRANSPCGFVTVKRGRSREQPCGRIFADIRKTRDPIGR